jgi:hypothetical protein
MGAMDSATRTVPTPFVSKRRDYKRVFTISAVAVLLLLSNSRDSVGDQVAFYHGQDAKGTGDRNFRQRPDPRISNEVFPSGL